MLCGSEFGYHRGMTIGELLAAMKDEHARGMQGAATQTFWSEVTVIMSRLSIQEAGPLDHDELVQLSVSKAWELIHRKFEYRGPEAFAGWLREIMRYEALALRRKGAKRARLAHDLGREPGPAGNRSPSSALFVCEQWRLVESAKKLLGPKQRESLEYADTHELAEAKNIPVATAGRLRRRAKKRLATLLRSPPP